MILLDAYALIALARGEPAAAEVAELLRAGEAGVAACNLVETYDFLVRRAGLAEEAVESAVEALLDETLAVVELDRARAGRAGLLRARLYGPSSELSLADCALLASLTAGDAVATADAPLARAARALGHAVRALPDSRGARP